MRRSEEREEALSRALDSFRTECLNAYLLNPESTAARISLYRTARRRAIDRIFAATRKVRTGGT
jgi:hypothetical protein